MGTREVDSATPDYNPAFCPLDAAGFPQQRLGGKPRTSLVAGACSGEALAVDLQNLFNA